ncbi:PREDICTED: lachesin-like, partial [Rhagoletis zephyria]|uniref:lachesin-like n=1 Tax=Rhagoletis zephyria TaxID=28612 RepID=UPI0008113E2C
MHLSQQNNEMFMLLLTYLRDFIVLPWLLLHLLRFVAFTVPPDILDYPTSTDMVIREGSNVTLKCAAVGSPTPTITWRREGGEPIPLPNNSEVIAYNGSYLTISKVKRLNMGAYLCIASNGIPPTVSKRVMLIVH